MWNLTEEKFNERLQRIQQKNQSIEYSNKLKEEKNKYKKQFRWPSTSKLVLLGAVFICIEIVIFCEYAMLLYGDMDSMYALIGIPAALAPIVLGYYSKAKAENTVGGITYETALRKESEEDEEAKG